MPTRPFAVPFAAGAAFALAYVVACGGLPDVIADELDAGVSTAPDASGPVACDCPAPPEPPKAVVLEGACDQEIGNDWNRRRYAAIPRGDLTDEQLAGAVASTCERECLPGPCAPQDARGERTCVSAGWGATADAILVECGELVKIQADDPWEGNTFTLARVRIAP